MDAAAEPEPRMMVRANRFRQSPVNVVSGATVHPRRRTSSRYTAIRCSACFHSGAQPTSRQRTQGRVKPSSTTSDTAPLASRTTPRITLRGYAIGKPSDIPQSPLQHSTAIRDDLTFVRMRGAATN